VTPLFYSNVKRLTRDLAAETFWRVPARFEVAQLLGPSYSLRCVLFHHISSARSPFTQGIGVSTAPEEFEAALRFFAEYYTPVRLEQVLEALDGRSLPPRAVLVTFDDAYASVAEIAAPLCQRFDVPAVFFVNAAFIDNLRLAADNLVCYVANVLGMQIISAAARAVRGKKEVPEFTSLAEVFTEFFPSLTLAQRDAFLEALRHLGNIDERRLAKEAGLYLTGAQLRAAASCDFEIGNHTHTHVHGRSLSMADFPQEIGTNKLELEAISGTRVRSFSQPYGSSKDITGDLEAYLEHSGHEVVFLSESVANSRDARPFCLDRVNPRTGSDGALFLDLEVLPRLRFIRNQCFHRPSRAGK
jgi:peptidoglycan/xylan/chitin deacetylase (PgdA/CDA1 family)